MGDQYDKRYEWGVMWDNGEIESCASEGVADMLARDFPQWGPIIVYRTVVKTEWKGRPW